MIITPRCLHPVAYRAKNDPGNGSSARCWRPAGHEGNRHRSRTAWERELAAKQAYRREQRAQRQRDPRPCGTEAAYKRHIRGGEVPCEACRAEANRMANLRRAA